MDAVSQADVIIVTAGLRRKASVARGRDAVEAMSVMVAIRAIERANGAGQPVTLRLVDVKWKRALEMACQQVGAVMEEEGDDIIRIIINYQYSADCLTSLHILCNLTLCKTLAFGNRACLPCDLSNTIFIIL